MRGGWAGYQRQPLGIGFYLREGAGQGGGIASPVGSGGGGTVFAGAGDGELNQHGCEGGEDDHGNGGDPAASAAIVALASHATKNHSPAGYRREVSNGTG